MTATLELPPAETSEKPSVHLAPIVLKKVAQWLVADGLVHRENEEIAVFLDMLPPVRLYLFEQLRELYKHADLEARELLSETLDYVGECGRAYHTRFAMQKAIAMALRQLPRLEHLSEVGICGAIYEFLYHRVGRHQAEERTEFIMNWFNLPYTAFEMHDD